LVFLFSSTGIRWFESAGARREHPQTEPRQVVVPQKIVRFTDLRLLPILLGSGAGSEVMSRIAAPMIGGMLTAPLLSMFVLPAAYLLLRRPRRGTPEITPASQQRSLS
jgi:hypothetical protein